MRLIVCAGERHKEGWTTHDVQDLPNTDIVCDFWDLTDHVKNQSCDEIEFTHALEHFPMRESRAVLRLLFGLLKPGGKIYIEVPNFYWHAEQIIQDPLNRQVVEYAFGGQLNKWDFHYNGFTPEILAEDMTDAGFYVESLQPLSSIECRGVRRG